MPTVLVFALNGPEKGRDELRVATRPHLDVRQTSLWTRTRLNSACLSCPLTSSGPDTASPIRSHHCDSSTVDFTMYSLLRSQILA